MKRLIVILENLPGWAQFILSVAISLVVSVLWVFVVNFIQGYFGGYTALIIFTVILIVTIVLYYRSRKDRPKLSALITFLLALYVVTITIIISTPPGQITSPWAVVSTPTPTPVT